MPGALENIIQADPQTYVANRIFDSMAILPEPASAEVSGVAYLLELGYRRFIPGDGVCLQRDSLLETFNLLDAAGLRYAA